MPNTEINYKFHDLQITSCNGEITLTQLSIDGDVDTIVITREQTPAVYKALANIHAELVGQS